MINYISLFIIFFKNYYRSICGICVADGGYAQTNVIYTPHPNLITNSQKRYNYAHIRTRNVVERVNGLLKSRFHCLCRKLGTATITSSNIIVACVILHNICVKFNLDLESDQEELQHKYETVNTVQINDDGNGFNIRNSFINRHFI